MKKSPKTKERDTVKHEFYQQSCPNCERTLKGTVMTDEGKYYLCEDCGYKLWK